ncbi:hypothetical protein [Brevundimonas sp.]|jgi:hypothetical protein|uniref:hypothetical protein n=1 Tax=Brevundimonas sp. TaxID=1871086 RepID=UPI002E0E6C2D|nr:hypothetical protein [Brevundimonas sp.]
MSLTAAALASALAFGPPPASALAQDPLTYENYVSCAALFFQVAADTQDAELKEALESAVGVMLVRATPLGEAKGKTQDQVVEDAAIESVGLEDAIASLSGAARDDRVRSHGPGIDACLDEVLTER